jgi:hypothetical protein
MAVPFRLRASELPGPGGDAGMGEPVIKTDAETSVEGRHGPGSGISGWTAVAGVVAILVAAVLVRPHLLGGPLGRSPDSGTSASARILSVEELRAAIAAERAGGLAPQDVVADVTIDASRVTPPLSRECDPFGQCQVIGTLAGFGDADGTVALRQESGDLPPATDAESLAAPLALRLTGHGPIEFLGHFDLAPSGASTWSVAEALAATATAPDEQAVAVAGWLKGASGFSCGPVPTAPLPDPFQCSGFVFLTPDPSRLVTSTGVGHTFSAPSDGIPVQSGAYAEYAPDPAYADENDEPRLAVYLLRMVAYDSAACPECRGWLVVGRLDAAPERLAEPAPVVRSPEELTALLGSERSQLVSRVLLVDGTVGPSTVGPCDGAGMCQIGTLTGTSEKIVASVETASMLPTVADFWTRGVLAVKVRSDGLEYLGYLGYNADNSFYFDPGQLDRPEMLNHAPLLLVVARGWLVDGGIHSCPLGIPAGPSETPAPQCPETWVASSSFQPVSGDVTGAWSVVTPTDAVRVQAGAYDEFAPDPTFEPNGVAHVPRQGSYLLRLIGSSSGSQSGWQIVARLDP